MDFKQAMEQTRQTASMFRARNRKPWSIEAMAVELCGEVGTLADSIMIKEDYRSLREGDTLDIEDDIADIFFVLFMIADHYGIDMDQEYEKLIRQTQAKLLASE